MILITNSQSAEKRLTSRPVRETHWKELRSKTLTALHIYRRSSYETCYVINMVLTDSKWNSKTGANKGKSCEWF